MTPTNHHWPTHNCPRIKDFAFDPRFEEATTKEPGVVEEDRWEPLGTLDGAMVWHSNSRYDRQFGQVGGDRAKGRGDFEVSNYLKTLD